MCRLAAYLGSEIPLENIIVAPRHSLLQQSQNANEAKLAVNGDGFGIAWYGHGERPGLYRDVLPAWSDGNLTSICRMVRSPLFMAHVRASSVGETSRMNCHPFTHGKWAFMHNGQIADFARIRRELEAKLPDELYHARRGTTDSELLFLLALAYGLNDDPRKAMRNALDDICKAQGNAAKPNRITCIFSDGEAVHGFRHSSDRCSPTLYASDKLCSGGRAIASEPLDGVPGNWRIIEEGHFVTLDRRGLKNRLFDA
jgi:predicted glutamine amidotransferase